MPNVQRALAPLLVALASLTLLTGCLGSASGDPTPQDLASPDLGVCRMLTPADVAQASNSSPSVGCSQPHTAQTFAVGTVPASLTRAPYDDPRIAALAYRFCADHFMGFTGADESLAMRTILSWAWFRPTTEAWKSGARWFRCDVVGGGAQAKSYVDLPAQAKGMLLGRVDDRWMVCARGAMVAGSLKVPCDQKHTWRAVTTIVLGGADAPYPGDTAVVAQTKDFCSKSVGAWLDYPVDYDFGYSWFQRPEWDAGNRRSVCWARTDR
jgi:Septum formation